MAAIPLRSVGLALVFVALGPALVQAQPLGFEEPKPLKAATPASACEWSSDFTAANLSGGSGGGEGLTVFDDGSGPALYVGGDFAKVGTLQVNAIAKWDGSSWSALTGPSGTGVRGTVASLEVYDDGSGPALYVAGRFDMAGGIPARNLARWDGATWSAVGTGTEGVDGGVVALEVFDDGGGPALYVGGAFSHAGGVSTLGLARWRAGAWSTPGSLFCSGAVYPCGVVNSFAKHDDGSGQALYLGGAFEAVGGVPATNIARWDGTTFSPLGAGIAPWVFDIESWDDGSGPGLYVGGFFTAAGGSVLANSIAKWQGGAWSALIDAGGNGVTEGLFNQTHDLEVYDPGDGSGSALYVAGWFEKAGGVAATHLARWTGSAWQAVTGPAPVGPDKPVYSLTVFDDGGGPALYALGLFGSAGDVVLNHVGKWKPSGWSALSPPTGLAPNSRIDDLRVFDDGSGPALYVAGAYSTADGTVIEGVGRFDGSAWHPLTGPMRPGIDNWGWTLEPWDDGSGEALYVAGGFKYAGGLPASNIARWNGATWQVLDGATTGLGTNWFVYDLEPWDDGNGEALYVAGDYSHAGGLLVNAIAKWDGFDWSALAGPSGVGVTGPRFSDDIDTVKVFDDGSGPALFGGGSFTHAGGVEANFIAKWDGTRWWPLPGSGGVVGVDNVVRSMEIIDGGNGPVLYVIGFFDHAGGLPIRNVATWSSAGWAAPAIPFGVGPGEWVNGIQVLDDGSGPKLYAFGTFHSIGGVAARNVARWDGQSWSALAGPSGEGIATPVATVAAFDDGSGPALYFGGRFLEAGGLPAQYLTRFRCRYADLSISKSDGVTVAVPGRDLVYSIVVSNHGSEAVVGALVEDDLPAALLGCTWTCSPSAGSSCTPAGSGDLSDLANLAAGGELHYTVSCQVDAAASGSLLNTATVSSPAEVADPDLLDNTAIDTDTLGPALVIASEVPATSGVPVSVPVELLTAGFALGGVSFSIDLDGGCLGFDPADADADGIPDAITAMTPAGFTVLASFDPGDTDGEIDVTIVDFVPPIAALPQGVLLTLALDPSCVPANGSTLVPVPFSAQPAPSFASTAAQAVAGAGIDGSVRLYGGLRGDCNGNGTLGVEDLIAVGYEIFDGDGSAWQAAGGGTFAGSPVGCDANADLTIDVADVICANERLNGRTCAAPLGEIGGQAELAIDGRVRLDAAGWRPFVLENAGLPVAAVAFSIDLDPAVFDFRSEDADLDGLPDGIRYLGAPTDLVSISHDPGDPDGELDVLIARLSGTPLPEGPLFEIELIPLASSLVMDGLAIAAAPAPSFGSTTGQSLPGEVLVSGMRIFADGFESGGTGAWSP